MIQYRVKFQQKPIGLKLKGTRDGRIFVAAFDTANSDVPPPHLTAVTIGDEIVGINDIRFDEDTNLSTHSAKVACIQRQEFPVFVHFCKHRDSRQLWRAGVVKVQAIHRIQRPVSRQRIGKSPVYRQGLIVEDVGDINTWFAEAKAVNERKRREHRKLYTGKIERRASIETWNRPGMIHLHPIRSVIVGDFLADNIARAEKRMMTEGARRQEQASKDRTRVIKAKIKDSLSPTPTQPVSRLVGRPDHRLVPIEARSQSLWKEGAKEVQRRILTRGVKMCGAWFILTVSRVRVDCRETGLRFVAHHVSSSTSPGSVWLHKKENRKDRPSWSSSCAMRMSWSTLVKALQEMGRTSLAERCLHCVSFPSPEFEIQARSFACAAFLMRRVSVERDGQGGWDMVVERPPPQQETNDIQNGHENTGGDSGGNDGNGGDSSNDNYDDNYDDNDDDSNVFDATVNSSTTGSSVFLTATGDEEKPYYSQSLASLPPRAGVLRTALHPDYFNWHRTKSRIELKQESLIDYEKSRPQVRSVLPLPSLRSPTANNGRKKKKRRRKRNKKESWVTPYGEIDLEALQRKQTNKKKKKKSIQKEGRPKDDDAKSRARDRQRLEARAAFLEGAMDPNITEEQRDALLNGAATVDRLRALDGFKPPPPLTQWTGNFQDTRGSTQVRYTDEQDADAAAQVEAMVMEVENEIHIECDGENRGTPNKLTISRAISTELLQTRLEAIDALEMVARFNSEYSLPPMPLVATPTATQGLYIPSSDSDDASENEIDDDDDDNDNDAEDQDSTPTPGTRSPPPPPLPIRPPTTTDAAALDALERSSAKKSSKKSSKRSPKRSPISPTLYEKIEHVFPAGPLGLSLGDCVEQMHPETNTPPSSPLSQHSSTVVVIAVERNCSAGQHVVKMGDVVTQIGDVLCTGKSFQQVLQFIRSASRPMKMIFLRERCPKSQTFVEQPGLIQSPPLPPKSPTATVTVGDLLSLVKTKT